MDLIREDKIVLERQTSLGKTWKSCCITADKGAVKYIIQVATIGGLFTTSLVMLIIDDNCVSQRNWSSLLTLCIGILCPSPRIQ
jgi:hypothetical protein